MIPARVIAAVSAVVAALLVLAAAAAVAAAPGHSVYLVINGNKMVALTQVMGLESESGVREIQQKSSQGTTVKQPVPAPAKPGKVTARYVEPKTDPLAIWRHEKLGQDVAIVLYGSGGEELSRLTLSKASLFQFSPAKPTEGQEVSITIAHEGVKLAK